MYNFQIKSSSIDDFDVKLPRTQKLVKNIIEKLGRYNPNYKIINKLCNNTAKSRIDSTARQIETEFWLETGESLSKTMDIFKQLQIYNDFLINNEVHDKKKITKG